MGEIRKYSPDDDILTILETRGEAGINYFKMLPKLISAARQRLRGFPNSNEDDPTVIKRQFKKGGVLGPETFNELIKIKEGDDKIRKAIFGEVIPALLACAEITRGKGAHAQAYKKALHNLVRGAIYHKNLEIVTPACPPYDYMITPDGKLKHQSGKLLSSIGRRFELAANTLKEVFFPLENLGVPVSFTVITYTGETNRLEDLVELGGDVITYYKNKNNENMIFKNLQEATAEAREVLERHWGSNGRVFSIETTFAPTINTAIADFRREFPRIVANHHLLDEKVGEWLKEKFGVNENWLLFFIEEENNYRKKQGVTFNEDPESVVLTAIREGLLYLLVLKEVGEKSNRVIVDLETTKDYMEGTLRHHPGPLIMGREFDMRNTTDPDPTRIRQPFNEPTIFS
jgi:hypothetical protein